MPLVNARDTGYGMNRMIEPSLAKPSTQRIAPAMIVHSHNPPCPWLCSTLYVMMTNAPVGPPICTRDPPNSAINAPPMIAVNNPCSGVAPDAIAKAIDRGNASVIALSPAKKSCRNVLAV
ncbi:MAG: hypothetical protein BWX86_02686 [Verrucomicrobia bacterium ADurb.Bin122]|nr:MAG: hypothetical protein BWX86_02686 [Verrucomicrobia bacterium ADurb.Bin122]